MTKLPTKANQSQLIDAVSKVLNVRLRNVDSWDEFADLVDNYDTGLSFPLSGAHVISERVPVYSEVLHPTSKQSYVCDAVVEVPDTVFLCMDKMLQGPKAVHVVICLSEPDRLTDWISYMGPDKKFVVNKTKEGDLILLASLKSFIQ